MSAPLASRFGATSATNEIVRPDAMKCRCPALERLPAAIR